MSHQKAADTDGRYSEICGATNNRGEPCQLPAGWGTPGSGGDRCRFHGGSSPGPQDTSHLDENDHAEDNPGGGAPELNTNAEIHGGFGDWRKAYERFDDDTREYVDRIAADVRETAAEHAPGVDAEERRELACEYATLFKMKSRAAADAWCDPDGDGPGRGFVVEKEREVDGDTYTVRRANPALRAEHTIRTRSREIAESLRLWPGLRDGE